MVLALVDVDTLLVGSSIPEHISKLTKTTNVHMRCLLRMSHVVIFLGLLGKLLVLVELLVKLRQLLL